MSKVDISLFLSASRPKWWKRMYESLIGNECKWEIVAVGPYPPLEEMPINFRYYKCDFKPTQCYAAASYLSRAELIGWTCDDAQYNAQSLDIIWKEYLFYKSMPITKWNEGKNIFTQRTIENNVDVSQEHRFFRYCDDTPQMAPMAFINREWFFKIGGYDRNYVCGQAENSICMESFNAGGKIININDSRVWINHEEVHGGFWNKVKYRFYKNSFRSGYFNDRRYLEETWIKEGFGTYNEKTLKHGTVSPVRLLPHQPYNYDNILTVPQGPQGRFLDLKEFYYKGQK